MKTTTLLLLMFVMSFNLAYAQMYDLPLTNGQKLTMECKNIGKEISHFRNEQHRLDYFLLSDQYLIAISKGTLVVFKLADGYLPLVYMLPEDTTFMWGDALIALDYNGVLEECPRQKNFRYSDIFRIENEEDDVWISVETKHDMRTVSFLYKTDSIKFQYNL